MQNLEFNPPTISAFFKEYIKLYYERGPEYNDYNKEDYSELLNNHNPIDSIQKLKMTHLYLEDGDMKSLVIMVAIKYEKGSEGLKLTPNEDNYDYKASDNLIEFIELLDLTDGECSPGISINTNPDDWVIITIIEKY